MMSLVIVIAEADPSAEATEKEGFSRFQAVRAENENCKIEGAITRAAKDYHEQEEKL